MSLPASLPHLLAWLATFAVHSTVLLAMAWVVTRPSRRRSARIRERVWRVAVIGPLLTASAASFLPHAPLRAPLLAPLWGVIPSTAPQQAQHQAQHQARPLAVSDATATESPAPVRIELPTSTSTAPAEIPSSALASEPDLRPEEPRGRRSHPSRPLAAPGSVQSAVQRPIQGSDGREQVARLGELLASTRSTARRAIERPRPQKPERAHPPAPQTAATLDLEAAPTAGIAVTASERDEAQRNAPGAGWVTRFESALEAVPRPGPGQATALLWTLPAAVLGLALVCSALRLAWDLRRRQVVRDAGLLARFDAVRRQAGLPSPVRLSVSMRLQSPITFGLVRPEVSLPPRALVDLSPAQERSLFAHELAHVVRRDPLWFAALALLERVLFFQPLLCVARKELVEVAEERADDLAVSWTEQPLALASCLAEIAGWILEKRRATALPIAGMANSRLGHRIERLLVHDPKPDPKQRWFAPAAVALLVTTAGAAPRIGTAASDRDVSRAADTPGPVQTIGAAQPTAALDPLVRQPRSLPNSPPPWDELLGSEFALLEEELELLDQELELLHAELDPCLEGPLADTLESLKMRLSGLQDMRDAARLMLDRILTLSTSLASTPRAGETASKNTQP